MYISKNSNGQFLANYTVDIVGQIYDDDIRHEEKSSVSELLGISDGKVKIIKTLGGRFWSVK